MQPKDGVTGPFGLRVSFEENNYLPGRGINIFCWVTVRVPMLIFPLKMRGIKRTLDLHILGFSRDTPSSDKLANKTYTC